MPADASGPRPPALIPDVRPPTAAVIGAIARAAKSTGASFDYLLATAKPRAPLSFHSLFENEERRGAVFPLGADLWARPRAAPGVAPVEAASGAPLDLFQDSPPSARRLFKGGA